MMYSYFSSPSCVTASPKRNFVHFFTLENVLHVIADLEITNNTKDCMQADINKQKHS